LDVLIEKLFKNFHCRLIVILRIPYASPARRRDVEFYNAG
jgi:hypothetical protein